MILPPAGVRVLIATRPVDFRRGADGLAATVQTMLRQNPFCGTVFAFRSKRADRVKMLVYDGTGLVLIWEAAGRREVQVAGDQRRVMRPSAAQLGVVRRARLAAGACAADRPAKGRWLRPASFDSPVG